MPLDLDELKRRLSAASSDGAILRLAPKTLDSPPIAGLIRDYLPGSILELTVKKRTDGQNGVAFTGTLGWPPFQDAPADVDFVVDHDHVAQAAITIRLPSAWRLCDGFSALAGTVLEEVTLAEAKLELRSAGYASAAGLALDDGNGPAPDDSPVFTVAGKLDRSAATAGPLAELHTLIPATSEVALHGRIELRDGLPCVALEADALAVEVGTATLSKAGLALISGPAADGRLAADVELDIETKTGASVRGSWPADSGLFFLTAQPGDHPLDSIEAVAGLFPAPFSALVDKLPGPQLFANAGLQLDHITIVLDLARSTVRLISAGVGTSRTWDVFEDERLVLDNIALLLIAAEPFSSPTLFGALSSNLTFGGVPFEVVTTTDKTVMARLAPGHALHPSAIAKAFLPDVPVTLPDLTQVEVRAGPGKAFGVNVATGAAWRIPCGSTDLEIGPVLVSIENTDPTGTAKPTGRIEGWASLFGATLHLRDELGGPLELSATLPTVPLGQALERFAPSFIDVPTGLAELHLDNASILIQHAQASDTIDVATDVRSGKTDFGTVELLTTRHGSAWDAALGFQLPDDWRLSALSPALHVFDNLVLHGTGLVLASYDGPCSFRTIDVPLDAKGVRRGIRFAAQLSLREGAVGGIATTRVSRILGVEIDHATLSATLTADLQEVDLAASIDGVFPLPGTPVTFTGVALQLGWHAPNVTVTLAGKFDVQAHKDTLHFTVALTLDPNGAYCAATMEGTWHDAFDVKGLDLTNVALVVGIDLEGVPTLGITGQLDMGAFDGSLALFFDSTSGAFVLAGSFSDITLADVASIFLHPGADVPAEIRAVLGDVGLRGLPVGSLDASVAGALDEAVADVQAGDALLDSLRTVLPDLKGPCGVARAHSGATTWYVTDRTLVRTWQIRPDAKGLAVSTETQLYLAEPKRVRIGEFEMDAGFRLGGQLHVRDLAFTIAVDGDPSPGGGFFAEANASDALDWSGVLRIARGKRAAGPVTSAGPFLSFATFDARSRGAQIAGPHFVLSGEVELFGVAGGDVDFSLTPDGFSGHVDGHAAGVGRISIDVRVASPLDFDAHGTVNVSIDASIPAVHVPNTSLLLVPAFHVQTAMNATVGLTVDGSGLTLEYGGTFSWNKRSVTVPTTKDTVTAEDVRHIEKMAERFAAHVVAEAGQIFHFLVANAEAWTRAMNAYFKGKIAQPEKVLRQQFKQTSQQIAGLLHQFGYGALRVYEVLAAEFSAVDAVKALASPLGLGMSAVQIAVLLAPHIPDPVKLGKLLVQSLDLSYWQLYKALKAAFGLSWSKLIAILKQIF